MVLSFINLYIAPILSHRISPVGTQGNHSASSTLLPLAVAHFRRASSMACFDVCPSLDTTTFFEVTSVSTEDTPAIFSLE